MTNHKCDLADSNRDGEAKGDLFLGNINNTGITCDSVGISTGSFYKDNGDFYGET